MRHLLLGAKRKMMRKVPGSTPRVSTEEYRDHLTKFSETGRDRGIETIFLAVGPEERRPPYQGIQPYREVMKSVARKYDHAFLDANCILRSGRKEARASERFKHYREMYRTILGDRYELADCGDSLIYETVDCDHPNAIGHQFIAENLLGVLCQRGIVSDPETCSLGRTDAPCLIP